MCQLYIPDRSIPVVVNGICCRLGELHQLFRPDQTIKDIPAGIINRKRRLNRLVELKSKVMVTTEKYDEVQHLERIFKRHVHKFTEKECAGMRPPISENDHSNFKQSFNGAPNR